MTAQAFLASLAVLLLLGPAPGRTRSRPAASQPASAPVEAPTGSEPRLGNVRQLTFGGENAEAYFSFDGRQLVFQTTRPPHACDQIYVMNSDGSSPRLVSSGKGRTTCAYFFPDGKSILYSSTHLAAPDCPPKPSYARGYVWPIYPGYDIFRVDLDGRPVARLTDSPGYDAEATFAPDGSRIVFTSDRDGDLDIYSMKPDGSDVRRLTNSEGYDGGPFFSPDSKRICYRGYHPADGKALADYRNLLAEHLIRPGVLDIRVMDADGKNSRVVFANGAANFAPYFHPSGEAIIFASNMDDPKGRNFDLYLVNIDGSGLERVTWNESFDGFPMFSPDGRRLVFASNRNAEQPGDTNLFIADWIE